jgi:hypothetical protein
VPITVAKALTTMERSTIISLFRFLARHPSFPDLSFAAAPPARADWPSAALPLGPDVVADPDASPSVVPPSLACRGMQLLVAPRPLITTMIRCSPLPSVCGAGERHGSFTLDKIALFLSCAGADKERLLDGSSAIIDHFDFDRHPGSLMILIHHQFVRRLRA